MDEPLTELDRRTFLQALGSGGRARRSSLGRETPIIAAAPAIANAVFAATGVRLRSMPLRGEALRTP